MRRDGFAVVPAVLTCDEVRDCLVHIESQSARDGVRRGGTRDVLDAIPELASVAEHKAVRGLVSQVLGEDARLVRATLFDKTPDANWKVPWHQDLTIAVDRRAEVEGFGPWSVKSGAIHVQPTTEVLEKMITVRVHLDPCAASNGALRVIPGTQRLGRVDQNEVKRWVDEPRAVTCTANAGDALVMRPLLLHASSASDSPSHRRVLHFDYAVGRLPADLQWRMRA